MHLDEIIRFIYGCIFYSFFCIVGRGEQLKGISICQLWGWPVVVELFICMQYGRQPAGNARKTGKWCDWCHPVYKHHKYCKLYCTRDYFCTSKKYKISACKIRLLMSNDLSFNCRRRKPRTCGLFSACVCTVLHTTPYLLPTVRFIAGV